MTYPADARAPDFRVVTSSFVGMAIAAYGFRLAKFIRLRPPDPVSSVVCPDLRAQHRCSQRGDGQWGLGAGEWLWLTRPLIGVLTTHYWRGGQAG